MNKTYLPSPKDDANTIEKAIYKIRYEKVEHLYIFKNNKQFRRFIGTTNQVSLPEKYLFEIENNVIIHNHPGGSSFSVEDLKTIIKYNAKTLLVATEAFLYSVERPLNGWKIDFDDPRTNKILNSCHTTASNALDKLISKNELAFFEKEKDLFHYIWLLFFSLYEIVYKKTAL
jgi:hypothetical protein